MLEGLFNMFRGNKNGDLHKKFDVSDVEADMKKEEAQEWEEKEWEARTAAAKKQPENLRDEDLEPVNPAEDEDYIEPADKRTHTKLKN